MNKLVFIWHGTDLLADKLAEGFVRMSVELETHNRPTSVSLWRSDGSGLRIQSKMHDLAERREVGVLKFSTAIDTNQKVSNNYELPTSFASKLKVTTLLITESGIKAESGILLEANDGKEIVIVAGAYPYTLAIQGGPNIAHIFEPEYPLKDYTKLPSSS